MYDHLTSTLGAAALEPYATGTLDDLVPEVRVQVDALIAEATKRGFKPKVRSVGRTCEQQDEQKKLGYSQAGLCRSMHVLGHAVDLDLSPNACSTYTALGQWWEARGGVWGGRWTQFGACGDAGHFHWGFDKAQAVPTKLCPADVTLAECRALREDYISKAKASARGSSGEKSYNVLAVGTFAVVGVLAAVAYFGQGVTKSNPRPLVVGAKPNKQKLFYHGSIGDPLDLLLHGLVARQDREGLSFTTTAARALHWAKLKDPDIDVVVLRVDARHLGRLTPENAWPAEPEKDFTSEHQKISPAVLQVRDGKEWVPLIDVYGELLDDREIKAWNKRWGRPS